MHNWFSVGEEVLVCSTKYPESNGEYRIISFISKQDACQRSTGSMYALDKFSQETYVILDNFSVKDRNVSWVVYDFTGINTLRKKYPPSSEGFQSLMSKIKDSVLEGVE